MDQSILTWLLEEENPEVRLRTLKEYEKLPEDDARVTDCKKRLLQSKVYERGLKKLRSDKPWAKYDAILSFAEWGLTRGDIGEDIDGEVKAPASKCCAANRSCSGIWSSWDTLRKKS